ncbi:hypothetical protein HaLaN_31702 [Haematococcus lacustris]|uniref:Uncharacterized protein n=1 Tax=Haematococcus lacustris TaxID=44745 RepID=A0A6A0AIX3_HAELA|nr:hypothetical protein HaLaN_31702 [Haematococcus lacustris]
MHEQHDITPGHSRGACLHGLQDFYVAAGSSGVQGRLLWSPPADSRVTVEAAVGPGQVAGKKGEVKGHVACLLVGLACTSPPADAALH